MSELHFEFLDNNRRKVFDKLESFSGDGVLGGGTALSLQIAHRRSYDFDVFVDKPLKKKVLREAQEVFGHASIRKLFEASIDCINSEVVGKEGVIDKDN